MIEFENYSIVKISKNDFKKIHHLMITNAERFRRYFPKTLEANSTMRLAKEFALKKEKAFHNKQEFLFVIKEKDNSLGLIYIKELDWQKKQGEYAYCLDKAYKGKGLMTKSIKKLTDYAFKNMGLEVLQIIVHKDNIASVKVAENAGFTWQRTLLQKFAPPGEDALDMELYELYKLPNANG